VRNGGLGIRSAQMLASSAFLASAASTLELQQSILFLPPSIQTLVDKSTETAEITWAALSAVSKRVGQQCCIQKALNGTVLANYKFYNSRHDVFLKCFAQLHSTAYTADSYRNYDFTLLIVPMPTHCY